MGRIAPGNRILAEYQFPYLAHAPLEPLSIAVRFDGDRAERLGTFARLATLEQIAIAQETRAETPGRYLHIGYAGGGFGRAAPLMRTWSGKALASRSISAAPRVKLMWTREDDIRGGHYRTMACSSQLRSGSVADALPTAWQHVVVGQSFMIDSGNRSKLLGQERPLTRSSSKAAPHSIRDPQRPRIGAPPEGKRPRPFVRSVGYSHNTFVMET